MVLLPNRIYLRKPALPRIVMPVDCVIQLRGLRPVIAGEEAFGGIALGRALIGVFAIERTARRQHRPKGEHHILADHIAIPTSDHPRAEPIGMMILLGLICGLSGE